LAVYLVRGRYPPVPDHLPVLEHERLSTLTSGAFSPQNPDSAGTRAPSATAATFRRTPASAHSNSGLKEIVNNHEYDNASEPQEPRAT
jgi:hypothetical protein